jgi:hypothetical protein
MHTNHSKSPIQYIIIRSVLTTASVRVHISCPPACLPASQTFSLVDIIKAESQSPRKKNTLRYAMQSKSCVISVCGIDRAVPVFAQKNSPSAVHRDLLSCRVAKDRPLRVRWWNFEACKSESSPRHAVARSNSPYPAMDRLRADMMLDVRLKNKVQLRCAQLYYSNRLISCSRS